FARSRVQSPHQERANATTRDARTLIHAGICDSLRGSKLRSALMHLSRRHLLSLAGQSIALAGTGLLAACQTGPQGQAPAPAAAPTQPPTTKPAIAPAASVAPVTV